MTTLMTRFTLFTIAVQVINKLRSPFTNTRNTVHPRTRKQSGFQAQAVIAIVCLLCCTTLGAAGGFHTHRPVSLQVTNGVSIPIPPGAYDVQEIPSLAGDVHIAYGINNAGEVVGFSMNGPGCCAQAFRFTPPSTVEFWPYGPITYGTAINDA